MRLGEEVTPSFCELDASSVSGDDMGTGEKTNQLFRAQDASSSSVSDDIVNDPVPVGSGPRRSARFRLKEARRNAVTSSTPHRLVRDRWFYESIVPAGYTIALLSVPGLPLTHDTDSAATSVADTSDHESVSHSSSSFVSSHSADLPDSAPPPPFRLLTSLLPGDGPTGRFQIRLRFPNGELPSQPFMVTTAMTVPVLESALARLMHISPPLSLLVAPRWELLNHLGFIGARFLPDMVTPCPYLQPG
jgi:hypothetical protein